MSDIIIQITRTCHFQTVQYTVVYIRIIVTTKHHRLVRFMNFVKCMLILHTIFVKFKYLFSIFCTYLCFNT